MKEIGQRLKELREEHNYSQTQVAEYLGIDQSNLSKMERGERKFRLRSLDKLCLLYNCSEDYILCRSDDYDKANIAFRADGKVDMDVIAKANEIMNYIKTLSKMDKKIEKGLLILKKSLDSERSAEELALDLRRQLGIDYYAPIDIFSLVSGKIDNLTLAWMDMDEILSGISYESEGKSFIIINSNHSKGRQNFTLAHELYHLFFDKSNTTYCRLNSDDPIEMKANLFASYFLMPSYALNDFCYENNIVRWSLRDMVKCEQLFQISHKALATRLHEEGYLDDVSFKLFTSPKFSIRKYATRLGYDTSLYGEPRHPKGNYVMGNLIPLVERQYEKKNISKEYRNEIFSNIFREDLIDEIKEDYHLY